MSLLVQILTALAVIACSLLVGVGLCLWFVRESQRQIGPGRVGRIFCWLGEHTDGKPNPMHWHTMTCIRCGKDFEL